MLKEIFDDGFEKFKIFKGDLMAKVVYLVQMLLALIGGRCNHFGDIQKKILRLPNFNMLFQVVLTKFFKS